MRPINRTKAAKDYGGNWVAFKTDRKSVIAKGTSPSAASKNAKKMGYNSPIVVFVPRKPKKFVG